MCSGFYHWLTVHVMLQGVGMTSTLTLLSYDCVQGARTAATTQVAQQHKATPPAQHSMRWQQTRPQLTQGSCCPHMPLFAASMAACLCMTVASNLMSMVVVGLLDSLLGCSTKWADTLEDKHK